MGYHSITASKFVKKLSYSLSNLLFLFAIVSCFLIIFHGTSAFKYGIFALSLAYIICTYKTIEFNSLWLELKKIALPWLPWISSTVVLMFVHGTKSLTQFFNAFLILCLIFIVLNDLKFKRKTLILCLCIGLLIINVAISIFLYKHGLQSDLLGANKNPLFAVITIINTTVISTILLDRNSYSKAESSFVLLVILFTLATTILAQTRHVLLAYPACACVFLLFAPKGTKKISIYLFVIFACMIISFFLTGRMQQGISDLVQYSHGNTYSSWGLRLSMWKMAILAFPEAPLFGWGDNAAQAMESAGAVPPIKDWFVSHFHNDFLIGLTMGGLVMASGWLCSLVCLTKNSIKDLPRLCSLASIVAVGMADQDWFEQDVLVPFVILWTLMYLTRSEENQLVSQ